MRHAGGKGCQDNSDDASPRAVLLLPTPTRPAPRRDSRALWNKYQTELILRRPKAKFKTQISFPGCCSLARWVVQVQREGAG